MKCTQVIPKPSRQLAKPPTLPQFQSTRFVSFSSKTDLPSAMTGRRFSTQEFEEDDLENATISQVLQAYKDRSLTPTQIARGTLARIRNMNQLMKAFTWCVSEVNAVVQTRDSDVRWRDGKSLGSLDGIPVSVKDVFLTKNIPTSCGTEMLTGFQSGYNATVVELLANQGSLIIGKTMMDEFGMGYLAINTRLM
jgi:Asp-tRNA(Asn)/Glu-tRNA(Gln) amidotransferase A subunit family amidase